MPSAYKNRLHFAVPVAEVAVLTAFLVTALGRAPDEIGFSVRASPNNTGEATTLLSSEVFTDEEVDALRPYVSPGGSGHLIGIRARRGFNEATETTTGEPGKTQVTVIESGEPIPQGADWDTTRVSFDRFLEELGLVRQEDAI